MKVKVEGSMSPGMKTVTFDDGGDREHVYLMEEALAKSLETRLNAFKYGILYDDKELVAMFKEPEYRDQSLQELKHIEERLTAFDAELV